MAMAVPTASLLSLPLLLPFLLLASGASLPRVTRFHPSPQPNSAPFSMLDTFRTYTFTSTSATSPSPPPLNASASAIFVDRPNAFVYIAGIAHPSVGRSSLFVAKLSHSLLSPNPPTLVWFATPLNATRFPTARPHALVVNRVGVFVSGVGSGRAFLLGLDIRQARSLWREPLVFGTGEVRTILSSSSSSSPSSAPNAANGPATLVVSGHLYHSARHAFEPFVARVDAVSGRPLVMNHHFSGIATSQNPHLHSPTNNATSNHNALLSVTAIAHIPAHDINNPFLLVATEAIIFPSKHSYAVFAHSIVSPHPGTTRKHHALYACRAASLTCTKLHVPHIHHFLADSHISSLSAPLTYDVPPTPGATHVRARAPASATLSPHAFVATDAGTVLRLDFAHVDHDDITHPTSTTKEEKDIPTHRVAWTDHLNSSILLSSVDASTVVAVYAHGAHVAVYDAASGALVSQWLRSGSRRVTCLAVMSVPDPSSSLVHVAYVGAAYRRGHAGEATPVLSLLQVTKRHPYVKAPLSHSTNSSDAVSSSSSPDKAEELRVREGEEATVTSGGGGEDKNNRNLEIETDDDEHNRSVLTVILLVFGSLLLFALVACGKSLWRHCCCFLSGSNTDSSSSSSDLNDNTKMHGGREHSASQYKHKKRRKTKHNASAMWHGTEDDSDNSQCEVYSRSGKSRSGKVPPSTHSLARFTVRTKATAASAFSAHHHHRHNAQHHGHDKDLPQGGSSNRIKMFHPSMPIRALSDPGRCKH